MVFIFIKDLRRNYRRLSKYKSSFEQSQTDAIPKIQDNTVTDVAIKVK
jgi:hypothetical protein